jgi:hypothetical protein
MYRDCLFFKTSSYYKEEGNYSSITIKNVFKDLYNFYIPNLSKRNTTANKLDKN